MMKRKKPWVAGTLGMLVALLPLPADAINEQWYSSLTTIRVTDGVGDEYFDERYGWTTSADSPPLIFFAPQFHFVGNNGYTSARAQVYDSSNDLGVYVYLCRQTGGEGTVIEVCEVQNTGNAFTSLAAQTLNWPSTADATRSYYYWYVIVPGRDDNGGGVGDHQSYFAGTRFTDN